jgi:hypothetical protein
VDSILYSPLATPEEWCESQPCIEFYLLSIKITLIQPSSTLFVYLLGLITLIFGIYTIRSGKEQRFINWWGVALILWGAGALFAGTSYQAFSYEIKCAGRSFCVWTSLWEIYYLILSVGSVNAMLLAQSNLGEKTLWSRIMTWYAVANFMVYLIVVFIGSIIPIKFLISFELLILFLTPSILLLLIFNIRKFYDKKERVYLSLVYIWVLLILIIGFYFFYFILDITNLLWEQGFWFSENDILHITLILWMSYIFRVTRRYSKNTREINDLS